MSGDPKTKEETWKTLVALAQQGDKNAKEKVVSENLGLVYMVLKRFANRGHDMEELFQIGAIGLMKAVDRFDLSRDLAFSTYAVPMIMGEIQRFLRDDGMIHISRQVKDNARKIAIVREKLKKTINHEPTLLELEKATQLSAEEITLALEASAEVDSISRPIYTGNSKDEGKEFTIEDQLEDHHQNEDRIIERIAVRQMLAHLEEKERRLVELRYMEGLTQAEVADILGMNQVAVSRLEKKILLHLRREW